MSSIFDALVLGVKDYAKKCGFKTALIGQSGGIDSALVSAIATAALGVIIFIASQCRLNGAHLIQRVMQKI